MSPQTQEARRASNARYKAKRIKDLGGIDAYREDQARKRREWYAKKRQERMNDPLRQQASAIIDDTARDQVEAYVDAARKLEEVAEAAPRIAQLGPVAERVSSARSAATLTFATGGSQDQNCERNIDIIIAWEKSLVEAGIAFPTKKTPVHRRSALRTVFSMLKRIYERIYGTPWFCDTYDWLKDKDRLYTELKSMYPHLPTQSTNIGKVTGLLRWLAFQGSDWAPTLQGMRDVQNEVSPQVQAIRALNLASDDEKANSLPWERMVELLDKIPKNDVHDRFLYGFQVLFAPRRLDIQYLTLVTDSSATEATLKSDKSPLTNDNNYYVRVDKKKAFFVFKRYKTSRDYSTQVFPVPPKLIPMANKYIKTYKITEGERFFRQGLQFSDYMVQLYKRVTGKEHMLQNYVRHSFSTWLSREYQNKSVKARMEFVNRMGHSLEESELYKRIEEDDDA